MRNQDNDSTKIILDLSLIKKVSHALDNVNRLNIVNILRDRKKNNSMGEDYPYHYSLNAKEITKELKEEYKTSMTEQGVRDHLKILKEAGLINKSPSRLNKDGEPLSNPNDAFYLMNDGFESLSLELKVMTNVFDDYTGLSDQSKKDDEKTCQITVVNGKNRGTTWTVKENQVATIGRAIPLNPNHVKELLLPLSTSYSTVSRINKPHLTVFNKEGTWFMRDGSTHGTYTKSNKLVKGEDNEIPNNSTVRLSRGLKCAILQFRYN